MFTNFDAACEFLSEELNWDLGNFPFEDLTFSYEAGELGLKPANSSAIESIHQLRPLPGGAPWSVFFIDFKTRKLRVSRMRDVLSSLVARKRASTNQAQRAVFPLGDLLFIIRFGTKWEPSFALVRFHDDKDRALPVIQSIEWTERDPSPRLKRIHSILAERLSWPEDTKNRTAWRKQWASTFEQEIETPEVLTQVHDYYVQKHLRSAPQNTPLKSEEYISLFKHIDETKNKIAKILCRFGFLVDFYLHQAASLEKGKIRFDSIVRSEEIESRERYMKALPKLSNQLRLTHQKCDDLYCRLESLGNLIGSDLQTDFAESLEKLYASCNDFRFNLDFTNELITSVRLFLVALLECRRALEKDPTNPALMMKIKAMQIQSWHDQEEFDESWKELRRLCKEIELLKNVIAATSQKRVEEIAMKFLDSGMDKEDLIQEGNLGLTKAIESFDFDLGSNFLASNYTYRMIENAVKKAIKEKSQFINIPREEMESIDKIKNCINMLAEDLGRPPSISEISRAIHLPLDRIERVIGMSKLQNIILLPRKEMINQMRLDTTVAGFETKDSEIDIACMRRNIQQVLLTMTDIEREVIELRFGMMDGYSHTLEEVGRRFQATRERIREIEAKALRKMRHPIRIRKLEGFIELPGA